MRCGHIVAAATHRAPLINKGVEHEKFCTRFFEDESGVTAIEYGLIAALIADFFLYTPGYTLYVSDPRQAGELFLFGLTALIGAKCTAELMRQVTKPF